MAQGKTKNDLIHDFEIMKAIEESARDLYLRISKDSRVRDSRAIEICSRIADDEQRHIGLVEKIINIIKDTL